MKIGLSYDLKEAAAVSSTHQTEDALEEYDSLETVEALEAAIQSQGHTTVRLGGGRGFLTIVLQEKVDLVFNIAEGLGNYRSREAQIPSVLEMLDIPYSGSDPATLALSLDKPLTNKIIALGGVSVPQCRVIENNKRLPEIDWAEFPFPVFVKPVHEGSSKGIRLNSLVEKSSRINEVVRKLLDLYQQPVMVEEFIAGDEVTVGMVGNSPPRMVGIMRIMPKKKEANFVYSLEVKRNYEQLVDYECPAQLSGNTLQLIEDAAQKIYHVLGCRDFSRLDFRIDNKGTPYFLEINPLPGLNPRTSDLGIMTRKMGWNYQSLVVAVLNAALERYSLCTHA